MKEANFDPTPVQWICGTCRDVRTLPEEYNAKWAPSCTKCGKENMRRMQSTLQVPRYLIFAIVCEDSIEERYFSFLPGQMAEPLLGSEVKLPLCDGDPIRETAEWKETGGWVYIHRRCVDYEAGNIWLEAHFVRAYSEV